MPTRHIAIAPDQLIIAAKKIADCVESYKASRYAGHYLITYEAINDARSLLLDVEDLIGSLRHGARPARGPRIVGNSYSWTPPPTSKGRL